MAGLFFAFSICVMKALGRLPPEQGIAAMQGINTDIQNPLFFLVFMGTAAACLWAVVFSLMHRQVPGIWYLFAAGTVYLAGVLLVTIIFNVPMNDALASAKPASPDSARLWANYLTTWTAWNHVRTVASLAATALFALAYRAVNQPTP